MIDQFSIFGFSFLYPWMLVHLLLIPLIFWRMQASRQKNQRKAYLTRSDKQLSNLALMWPERLKTALNVSKSLACAAFIFAFAGPYKYENQEGLEDYKKGIDIVLAMDVSLSMYARDFQPNRLEAAKNVAKEFVSSRNGDRIGLVVYAGEAYTACPSTLNYEIVLKQLDELTGEYIEGGTAIGVGLGTAVTRLRSDSLTTKVIILLTDGSNNAGEISPEIAAELAVAKNIRVYTIGVGTTGDALSPVVTPFGIRFENIPVEIDENTLQMIAQKTGGQYFRATDEEKLAQIYTEIEKIEKQRFLDKIYQGEPPANPTMFILIGVLLLILVSFIELLVFNNSYE